MAEKRMLAKVISISEKVNMLPDVFDMLLFTWMIPHTDDFGRLAGSPAKVKALVVPMLDKSLRDVETALNHLSAADLIFWYEVAGEKVVQINDFEKHQQGLHKRTRSKFADPPTSIDEELPGNSGNIPKIPLELNRTELNRTEEKGTEQKDTGSAYRLFEEQGFGTISSIIADQIGDLVQTYGLRWYEEAVKVAVIAGKRSLSYVNGILKSWKASGIDDPWREDNNAKSKGRAKGVQSGSNSAASGSQSEYSKLDEQQQWKPRQNAAN